MGPRKVGGSVLVVSRQRLLGEHDLGAGRSLVGWAGVKLVDSLRGAVRRSGGS